MNSSTKKAKKPRTALASARMKTGTSSTERAPMAIGPPNTIAIAATSGFSRNHADQSVIRLRPRGKSKTFRPLKSGEFLLAFEFAELLDPLFGRGVGGGDLADKARPDRDDEEGVHLGLFAEVVLRHVVHPAADRHQCGGQRPGVAGDRGRPTVRGVLAVAAERPDEEKGDHPDDQRGED